MALSYYFDHNVWRSIANGVRRHGIDVLTALDDGMHAAADDSILDRAWELGRVSRKS